MHKINLHAHTVYSDGANRIKQMADACKKLGFSACVITDHIYSVNNKFSNNYSGFIKQCFEVENVSKYVDIPIILGAELSVARYEECLLFGRSAIEDILMIRDKKILRNYNPRIESMCSIEELKELREKHQCTVFLAHPNLAAYEDRLGFIKDDGAQVIDGYEIVNSGQRIFDKKKTIPKEFESLAQLCNSDAHTFYALNRCYNLTTEEIKTEEDLYYYIKKGGEFKPIINSVVKT